MSLQRIFASAKKLGVPVIITDPEGHEPMVMLALEQFEALTHVKTPGKSVKEMEHIPEEVRQEMPSPEIEGISLEERFYLEPIDEQT